MYISGQSGRFLGAIVAALFVTSAHAATVDFLVTGTLGQSYGSDDYDLAGADITWTFSYDTTASNVGTGGSSDRTTATYDAVSVDVSFTNRPNGASDTFLNLDTAAFLTTVNVFSGADVDMLETISGSGVLPDDGSGSNGLAGLTYSDFIFELSSQNFFTGTGAAALPVLTNPDISAIFTPLIEEGFMFTAGYEFTSLGLAVTNNTLVPIPAALWLFGSGLLVLAAGFARRGSAA